MKIVRASKAVIKRMSILAVLLSGVILAGTSVASAQDCLRFDDKAKTDEEIFAQANRIKEINTRANRDCWVRKARSGEKDLRWANLDDADLRGANLSGANLSGAMLIGANLEGANLTGSDLRSATLFGMNLRGADLTGADLSEASLSYIARAKENRAFLINLKEADPSNEILRESELEFGERWWEEEISDELLKKMVHFAAIIGSKIGGAEVSRSTTKGVDFADWEKRGGVVVD